MIINLSSPHKPYHIAVQEKCRSNPVKILKITTIMINKSGERESQNYENWAAIYCTRIFPSNVLPFAITRL
jgi:hypothetical protein